MFKDIKNNITRLFITISLAVSIVSCQDQSDLDNLTYDNNDGAAVFSITRAGSSSNELPDNTTLRIFNTADRLIARYAVSEIPDAIYLAAGSYKATVTIGEAVEISDSKDVISYFGEQNFTIAGGEVSNLNIKCTVQNSVVEVIFDQTVFDRFEMEAVSYLSLSNTFSFEDAKAESVPTLTFRADGTGYFILPNGVDNISWGFYGESANIDPTTPIPAKIATFSGVIEDPQAATKYTLKFAYSPTPEGALDLMVTVDESVDEFNDLFAFSPQPTFEGQGFDLFAEGLVFAGEDIIIDVASVNDLSDLDITSKEFVRGDIKVMESGVINSIDGVNFELTDAKSGVLTLSRALFANFGGYGTHSMRFSATDKMGSEGHEDMSILTGGALNSATFDLWNNTGVLSAKLLLNNVSSVKFAHKAVDSDTWYEVEATKGADNTYSATTEAVWSSSTNIAKHTIYTLESGFSAESDYNFKIIVDGMEYAPITITTPKGQAIPNGDMNSGDIKAFGTSGSSSSDWTSGNNTYSKSLCKQTTKDGRVCAILKSTTAAGVFAAGNLIYGQFAMGTFSGTMKFGQPFAWSCRPQSLRLSYSAIVGDETHDGGNRLDGKDVARIYIAMVDWSGRHGVTAGTSGEADGTWDPEKQTSTDEGKIIGYGSMLITESTDSFVDIEIPIHYYDYTVKPSGEITLVISCAASSFGDYMTGSTGSHLWVDDFAFGY